MSNSAVATTDRGSGFAVRQVQVAAAAALEAYIRLSYVGGVPGRSDLSNLDIAASRCISL